MKTLFGLGLLSAFLLAGSYAASAQVNIGIQIGAPPPPRVVVERPVAPDPEFVWIEGYWYPVSGHYRWHEGYWSRPPYAGAVWVVPRHEGGRYYGGYWDGPRGKFDHDHHWDRESKVRDEARFKDHDDHGRGHAYGHDKDKDNHGHDH